MKNHERKIHFSFKDSYIFCILLLSIAIFYKVYLSYMQLFSIYLKSKLYSLKLVRTLLCMCEYFSMGLPSQQCEATCGVCLLHSQRQSDKFTFFTFSIFWQNSTLGRFCEKTPTHLWIDYSPDMAQDIPKVCFFYYIK